MNQKKKIILNISLIAIFSALSFVSVYLNIPIPSPVGRPMVHLGNTIVVLVSLFFGGIDGGVAGAIGMGLYDLCNGYGLWSFKTVILKFLLGLCTGLFFSFYKKHQTKAKPLLLSFSGLFFLFGIFFLVFSLKNNGEIKLTASSASINIYWSLYAFAFLQSILLFGLSFIRKIEEETKLALAASSIGIIINILGEFFGKLVKMLILGNGWDASVIASIVSLPATILNGFFTLLLITIFFPPLKRLIPLQFNKKNGN
jgi:uncharacterized membrane protein